MTPIKIWLNNLEKALSDGRITPATHVDQDTLVVVKNVQDNSFFASEFNMLPQSHKEFYLNLKPRDVVQNIKIIAVFDIWDDETKTEVNTSKSIFS